MTRIVAGAARGRRLVVPPGRSTRPTADRTREAMLSTVESLLGPLTGSRVADLYAGSGAVGLEALSRGATEVLLVENDRAALHALRSNVSALALPGAVVVATAVERLVAAPPVRPPASAERPAAAYDWVFLDPPYALAADQLIRVLDDLAANGWLAEGALVVVERASRAAELVWPAAYTFVQTRRYGEATLWYGRAASTRPPVAPPADGTRGTD